MHSSNKKCIAIVGIKFWVKHYKYTIIIEKGEGNFSAYAPDLPGVVAAGETEEETVNLMAEAIELHRGIERGQTANFTTDRLSQKR